MAETKTTKKNNTSAETQESSSKKKPSKKKVGLNDLVDVQSCVVGNLIWVSRRTGYEVRWNDFGDINPMRVNDLIDMRNEYRTFFTKNRIALVGDNAEEVLEYLQMEKFYKDIKRPSDLDDIILGDPSDIESSYTSMTDGVKQAFAYRAAQLYKDGEIDSAKTVSEIRRVAGVDISL